MSWEIYIDGELVDARLDKIVDELDGIRYARFSLPNTDDNRDLVGSDRSVVIKYDGTTVFEGTLTGAKYEAQVLKAIAYDSVYYSMDGKVHSGDYTSTPADTILSDICSSAGVSAGECPSDSLSVKFISTDCWVAATFLAYCLNKDFWTSDGKFNIGDKGEDKGEVSPTAIGKREVNRAKIYNKVIVRGYDKDGNELVAEASVGSGDRAKVFFERKATDLATLQNIAQKKLSELSAGAVGGKIILTVDDGVYLNSGDTITINDELRNLSSSYRIARITKKADRVEVELEVKDKSIADRFRDQFSNLEDLGIYLVSSHLEVPSGTAFPSSPSTGQLFYRTDLDACFRYNGSSWDKIARTSGEGTAFPSNPSTGDLFYKTDENALYRYDGSDWKVVHQLSTHGTSFPASPRIGDFFYNTDDGYLYRYDGSEWRKVMHQAYGSSFPSNPEAGDTFYHTGYEQTFYYNGSEWIPLATICRYGTSFPANAEDGDIFYRTDENKFYRYDGSSWHFIATPNLANMDGDLDDISDGSSKKTIEVVSSLPSASSYTGKYVYVTGGEYAGQTFYSDGSEWIPQHPEFSYKFREHVRITGESLDGWLVEADYGSVTASIGRIDLDTGYQSGVAPVANISSGSAIVRNERNPSFKCKITPDYDSNQRILILIYNENTPLDQWGFDIEDATIRARVRVSDTTYLTDIGTITAGTPVELEARYEYGSSIKFYVNGELKHTETTNLPTTDDAYLLIQISADMDYQRTMTLWYFDLFQEWS